MTFQLMLFPDFRDKAVTLSYDDGSVHDVRLVEILNKYGLKGTFNLNSGRAVDNGWNLPKERFQSLYLDNGHEIALHGEDHLSLTAIPEERIVHEIHADRLALEELTGGLVTGMAYANGGFDDRVVRCLKACGVDYARTTLSTGGFDIDDDWLRLKATCHHNDPELMKWVDEFFAPPKSSYFWAKKPKLFYLWGHSYEFDGNGNWNVIEEFAKKIGGREDVWYATNGEIVRYVEAFKALRFSADGKRAYNPTAIDVYYRTTADKKVVIPAGKTVEL